MSYNENPLTGGYMGDYRRVLYGLLSGKVGGTLLLICLVFRGLESKGCTYSLQGPRVPETFPRFCG